MQWIGYPSISDMVYTNNFDSDPKSNSVVPGNTNIIQNPPLPFSRADREEPWIPTKVEIYFDCQMLLDKNCYPTFFYAVPLPPHPTLLLNPAPTSA